MVLLIAVITALLFLLFITWFIHISESKSEGRDYGWASYEQFKTQYHLRNWSGEALWQYGDDKDTLIQHEVFMFNNKVMIMRTPFDLLQVWVFLKLNYQEWNESSSKNRNRVKW